MKNKFGTPVDDDLRPEYAETILKDGVRGKYAARYRSGTNLVLLTPDVAAAFPTSESVNEVLRMLIKVARHSTTTAETR